MSRGVCEECGGTGVVPDSIDNYVYDPWCMAPCPSCTKSEPDEPPAEAAAPEPPDPPKRPA